MLASLSAPFSAFWLTLVACGEGPGSLPERATGGGAGMSAASAGSANVAGSAGAAGSAGVAGSTESTGGQPNGAAGTDGSPGTGVTAGTAGSGALGGAGNPSGGAPAGGNGGQTSAPYPPVAEVLDVLARANQQFADKWPDTGAPIVVGGTSRQSNIWTRAVYYEGLLNLYAVDPKPAYKDYALAWGNAHSWQLRNNDPSTTNADNQCAGQPFIDLYNLDGAKDAVRIAAIKTSIDGMVSSKVANVWTWVDAIQMAMPVFARLGVMNPSGGYFVAMYALYSHPKKTLALYNTTDHLWWRDTPWKNQRTPAGKQVYWSRGNGWVFAALARVLDLLPATEPHRAEYLQDFTEMAAALKGIQREDGFWNPSLGDPTHFGGPEASGTSLFIYGMAWGVRKGLLDEPTYAPIIVKAWKSLVATSLQPTGFLGYMQSTGDDPGDGQPLSATKVPDFEDYGVGCFLLGGSELAKLAAR
ncbi:MAG TPA: glycoside hydrolase family 88 protein [Polyangiaceae bacterium]|nr:glycoside hydrolase family 88 protein [Polyangiaceae bacterium]